MGLYSAKSPTEAHLIAGASVAPVNDNSHRIGDIIISVNNDNPALQYGGVWELLAPGKTLVCIDTADTDFNEVRKTGGAKTHTLTVAQMPSHTHTQNAHNHGQDSHNHGSVPHQGGLGASNPPNTAWAQGWFFSGGGTDWKQPGIWNTTATNKNTGGGQAHNNLQPYMVVYMWVKIA